MVMVFGTRKADAPERGNGIYLRRFKKGETRVRFLYETDDWTEYWEHFTPDKKSFPCTEDRTTCPGCTSDNENVAKASRKYATQVLMVKTNQVVPFVIPVSLADALGRRAERNEGKITTRDYAIMRSGDGFDTEYDVDQEAAYPVDLDELRAKISVEIQDCFRESYNAVWGTDAKPAAQTAETAQPDSADTAASAATDTVLTEAKIRAMERSGLRDLCDQHSLAYDSTDTKSELVEKLLASFGD